jgi:hypothetical protein
MQTAKAVALNLFLGLVAVALVLGILFLMGYGHQLGESLAAH